MSGNRKNTKTKSEWIDPDDAPELDDAFFDRAEIREARVLIREGKPPIGRPAAETPKQAVSLRIDADVIAYFKADGPGWQTRINETLRKSLRRKPAAHKADVRKTDAGKTDAGKTVAGKADAGKADAGNASQSKVSKGKAKKKA